MPMSPRRIRWISRFGVIVLRLLASTWRIRLHNAEPMRQWRKEHRVIFALWHGEMLPLIWQHRNENACVVISEHSDGEIIARMVHSLGYTTVRGSTTRSGGRALVGLIRAISEGHDGAVTPDGPRGPAHVFAPGAAIAAQRSGAPIVAVSRILRLRMRGDFRSWDQFLIPGSRSRGLTCGTAIRFRRWRLRRATPRTRRPGSSGCWPPWAASRRVHISDAVWYGNPVHCPPRDVRRAVAALVGVPPWRGRRRMAQ